MRSPLPRPLLAGAMLLVGACAPADDTATVEEHTTGEETSFALPELDLGRWPERVRLAIEEALETARAKPDDAEAVGELGLRYYGADFAQAAATCLERATELDPRSVRWPYSLAIALERAGDPPAAMAALETAHARDPDSLPVLVMLGTFLAETDPERGARLLKRAVELDSGEARAHFGLGQCARRAGKREEALAEYRRAIDIFPSYAEAHYAAAMLLTAMGQPEEAQRHLARHAGGEAPPLHNDPWRADLLRRRDNASELRKRAERLARQGHVDEAAALLDESIAIDESGATSHVQKGVFLARQGRLEEAVGHFRQALEADPRNVQAKSALGLAVAGLGRRDEAERIWREVLEAHPAHAATLVYLGQQLVRSGRADEGIDLLRRGVESQPAIGLYRYVLGLALLGSGNPELAGEAVTHLERVASSGTPSPRVLEALARAYEAVGRGDDAARTRTRAAEPSGPPP